MKPAYMQRLLAGTALVMALAGPFLLISSSFGQWLPDDHYTKGKEFASQGKLDEAEAEFTRALGSKPSNADIYMARGDLYLRKGDLDKTISDYSKAIEINPSFVNAYHQRGFTYGLQNKYDLAIRDFDEAIKINPADPAPYTGRSFIYILQKQYKLAITDADKALGLDPKWYAAYYNKAFAYDQLGNAVEALKNYKTFLQTLRTQDPFIRYNADYAKKRLEELSAR